MEIAFLSSDKLRLELDRSRGGVSARILGVFYSRPDHFITTMLLGNNVALVIYGLLTAVLMEPWLKSLLGENDVPDPLGAVGHQYATDPLRRGVPPEGYLPC